MLPWSADLAGRLDEHVLDSVLLRDNPLGDPHERPLWVYTPPGYDDAPATRWPSFYVIQGYTGHVAMWRNRSPFQQPFIETADARYRTIADRESRAISGKSSGGYGAMITPMLRPDLFGALATHAGDAFFEMAYVRDFGTAVRHLRQWDGDILRWWGDFQSRTAFTNDADYDLLEILGCSACYSADDDGTPALPFDPRSGALRLDVWQRWLDRDPVRMVERHRDAVRSWRAVWIDAGTRDEWFLDLGAQAFRDELARVGVPDDRIAFELFDATHMAIDYRYPMALSWLAHRLAR